MSRCDPRCFDQEQNICKCGETPYSPSCDCNAMWGCRSGCASNKEVCINIKCEEYQPEYAAESQRIKDYWKNRHG